MTRVNAAEAEARVVAVVLAQGKPVTVKKIARAAAMREELVVVMLTRAASHGLIRRASSNLWMAEDLGPWHD